MKISDKKRERISEQILAFLYSQSPKVIFTAHIAREIARDEEFVRILLEGLEKKRLVVSVKKNPQGVDYLRRVRWRLSELAHKIYKEHQNNPK